jgi:hypothetical protein
MFKTRSKYFCEILGNPKEMNQSVLPTYHDVMLYYLFVQHEQTNLNSGKNAEVGKILEIVVPKIINIWKTSCIPTVSHIRICNMIKKFHGHYKNLQKNFKARKGTSIMQSKIKCFIDDASKLFEIAACKCDTKICKCEKLKKVPIIERDFLRDQRTVRKMAIGSLDIATTKKINKNKERKFKKTETTIAKVNLNNKRERDNSKEMNVLLPSTSTFS